MIGEVPGQASRAVYLATRDSPLLLSWVRDGAASANWGDKLNPVLARSLSQKNVLHVDDIRGETDLPVYSAIGSTLLHALTRPYDIWGTGFLRKGEVPAAPVRARIHAVRGHLSRQRLRDLGIDCPDVVGDPALLLPKFYTPTPAGRRYGLGVIPHCRELDLLTAEQMPEDSLLIDITGGIFAVVDQICACDFIASSSLHGLICAEAYGIPARWMKLSDRPLGDGFKFHDFYSSIGQEVDGPVMVSDAAQLKSIRDGHRDHRRRIDLDRLLAACPFRAG